MSQCGLVVAQQTNGRDAGDLLYVIFRDFFLTEGIMASRAFACEQFLKDTCSYANCSLKIMRTHI